MHIHLKIDFQPENVGFFADKSISDSEKLCSVKIQLLFSKIPEVI